MAVFELGGALAPVLPELMVGPWTRTPPGIAAFDAGAGDAGADRPESLWRVDLARDDAANRAALAGGERSVARAHAALDDVPRRLDRALARALDELAHASRPGQACGNRGRAPAPELPEVESTLIAALTRAEALLPDPELPPPWPAGSSGASKVSARTPGRLEQVLQCAGDLARGRARIETHVEGALVARSVTMLSGDTELWVAPRLSLAGAGLHASSVAIALRTRHAWARILALVMACCGRLAALGMPPAGVAALPLVWGFLRDMLREARSLVAAPGTA